MTEARPGPIAYLTGEYPKVSHTFIEREIAALRGLGLTVLTCTVRRPPPAAVVGAGQQAEAAGTFCILETARSPWRLLAAQAAALRAAPGHWARAAALAWRTRPPGAKALLWQLFYLLEAAVLARHLRAEGVCHLHNHFADSSCTVALLASEMTGIPFSFTPHGPAIFFEPAKWRLDVKTERAAFVACISQFCRSQMMLFSDPAQWGKLKIVHCGVDPAAYGRRRRLEAVPEAPSREAPEATAMPGQGARILFVGRLAAVKGVPLLLEAFADLAACFPEARLEIVGDGPDRAALEARSAALGLGGQVIFHGYRPSDAVAALMDEVDMLVLPSFAEGVPVVLMEAMASRIPVVASRVAGVPELVEDGISGLLVPPGDVAALSDAVAHLLADPALRARMGGAGRVKVELEFDVGKEAARMGALFDGSLGR